MSNSSFARRSLLLVRLCHEGEVMGFRLFRATGLAFAVRPKDGVARQGHIQSSVSSVQQLPGQTKRLRPPHGRVAHGVLHLPGPGCSVLEEVRGASHRHVYHCKGGRAWHGPRIGQVARRSLAHQARCRQARHFVRGEGHGHRGQLRGLQSLCDGFLASSYPALHRPEFFWPVQGAGPGLRISIQSEGPELGEVKGIVLGKVLYFNRPPLVITEGSSACAVKARAQTIQRECERKAAVADAKHNGTLPGAQGPIAAKLASFGKVQALAFGWFGECSPALEHLLSRAAEFGSQ